MSIKSLYPDIRPSLLLDFANAKQLDPRITFTRNSTATYVGRDGLIKTAGLNQPRFDHDPITGESLGLLIEESKTNIIATNIDNWSVNSTIKTTNAGIAPDGTNTANKCIRGPIATYQNISSSVANVPTGVPLIMSWYLKAAETDSIFFQTNDGNWINATFDISAGGSSGGSSIDDRGMYAVGNGWYRCWVRFDSASNTLNLTFHPITSSPVSGNSVDGTLIWGVQLEEGTFPTSYIPTSGSTVTRSVDIATITGTNFSSWYNASESTILCDYSHIMSSYTAGQASGNERAYRFRAVGGNDTRIDYVTHNAYHPYIAADGSEVANLTGFTGLYDNQLNKTAVVVKQNDFAVASNGSIEDTDTSGTWPPSNTITEVSIGGSQNGGNALNGHIKKFSYYPKRLTDAQLQTLTK